MRKTVIRVFGLVLWLCSACSAGTLRSNETPAPSGTNDTSETTTTGSTSGGTVDAPTTVLSDCPLGQQTNGIIGGPSICCSGTYAVCDDFEDGAPGDNPNGLLWDVEKMASTYGLEPSDNPNQATVDNAVSITLTDKMAARGRQSLLIQATNSSSLPNGGWHHDMIVNRTLFPAPNNTFWGRAFVFYVSDTNSMVANGHCTFVDASGPVAGNNNSTFYTWWRLSTFGGNLAINCEHGDSTAGSSTYIPTNRWACLEWQYKGPVGEPNGTLANTNEVHLYLDGNQLASTTASTETADNTAGVAPIYDAFRIGFETYGYQYNPTPTYFQMYYDEVALDFNRIGCAN